jgi:NAD-dependent dihydropyrimidine dehydrogenase PreA subunit
MAHDIHHTPYHGLVERLNRFPQGAPPSDLLFRILAMLFSQKEAELAALLPIWPFSAKKAAKVWGMDIASARKILEGLADRAILVDIEQDGEMLYCLPPPMAGFFEFSLMRVRGDLDQKVLSELFYRYINEEEEFIRALFVEGETSLGRVFVQEAALSEENALHVLDYERASEVVRSAEAIGIGVCYCRHKMTHVGKACSAPLNICMTFNTTAASLTRHGYARRVDVPECLDLLAEAQSRNLVQFGENVQRRVNFICNCCGCCCEAMLAVKRFGFTRTIHSNFIAAVRETECLGCGQCVSVCPVGAVDLRPWAGGPDQGEEVAGIDREVCLGCGVCVRNCPNGAIFLDSRPERALTPLNTTHRTVAMALERGTLQHLVFDNQVMFGHRALAALLGAILNLPPVKRAAASRQLKSRYLEGLIGRLGG